MNHTCWTALSAIGSTSVSHRSCAEPHLLLSSPQEWVHRVPLCWVHHRVSAPQHHLEGSLECWKIYILSVKQKKEELTRLSICQRDHFSNQRVRIHTLTYLSVVENPGTLLFTPTPFPLIHNRFERDRLHTELEVGMKQRRKWFIFTDVQQLYDYAREVDTDSLYNLSRISNRKDKDTRARKQRRGRTTKLKPSSKHYGNVGTNTIIRAGGKRRKVLMNEACILPAAVSAHSF